MVSTDSVVSTDSMVSTDGEIIRASLDAPPRFGEIFERHATSVEGFVASRVGREAKDDVLSETFLVAFRRRAKFDESASSARPWLLGIATRLIRRHRAVEAANWRSFIAASGAGERGSEFDVDIATNRLDAAARLRELAPRIAALSAREREMLFLYAWGDLTYEEIASALGVPIGTVRSRLSRVRQRLSTAPIPATTPAAPRPTVRAVIDHGLIEQRA